MNLYLRVWSTTQYGDDIKAMTFYNKHYQVNASEVTWINWPIRSSFGSCWVLGKMLVFSLAKAPLSVSQNATRAVNLLYCRSPGKKYVLPFSWRDNYRDKLWFDIIISWWWMFPDCNFISGLGSVYIRFTQKQNYRVLSWLASNITAGTSYTYLLHT